ncbi:uncharacterized protein ACIQIH_000212 [Cyanocitta cristata]
MSLLADPENPPAPPCPCRCLCPNRDQTQNRPQDQNWDQHRDPNRTRSRCRRLAPALAALAALALGAAAAAAAVLGTLRGQPPVKAATAAHVLLSAGSLSLPSSLGWRYEDGVQGVFLSGDVRPDTAGTLQVTSGGLYLLYGQLGLTCTAAKCPQGRVTLWLRRAASQRPLLAVPLTLPAAAGGHQERSALAQAVGQLRPGDVLSLELVGDARGDTAGDTGGWQLAQDEREGNFVGLLRIAGG